MTNPTTTPPAPPTAQIAPMPPPAPPAPIPTQRSTHRTTSSSTGRRLIMMPLGQAVIIIAAVIALAIETMWAKLGWHWTATITGLDVAAAAYVVWRLRHPRRKGTPGGGLRGWLGGARRGTPSGSRGTTSQKGSLGGPVGKGKGLFSELFGRKPGANPGGGPSGGPPKPPGGGKGNGFGAWLRKHLPHRGSKPATPATGSKPPTGGGKPPSASGRTGWRRFLPFGRNKTPGTGPGNSPASTQPVKKGNAMTAPTGPTPNKPANASAPAGQAAPKLGPAAGTNYPSASGPSVQVSASGPQGPDVEMGLHKWGRSIKKSGGEVEQGVRSVAALLNHALENLPINTTMKDRVEDAKRLGDAYAKAVQELGVAYNAHHADDEARVAGARGGVHKEARADVSRAIRDGVA